MDAYALDIDIPRKYGVEQCVGDTLGPGGVFRGLRTIPALLDLCNEMDEMAPDALLLNYVNPMSINCWAVADGSGRPHVGLCHSVQGTSEMLARWIDVPYDEVRSFVQGSITKPGFSNSSGARRIFTRGSGQRLNAMKSWVRNLCGAS